MIKNTIITVFVYSCIRVFLQREVPVVLRMHDSTATVLHCAILDSNVIERTGTDIKCQNHFPLAAMSEWPCHL